MVCRDCDNGERRARRRGTSKIPDELCSRCGRLLGADEVVERVLHKQSQLAAFGLAGPRGALLKRRGR